MKSIITNPRIDELLRQGRVEEALCEHLKPAQADGAGIRAWIKQRSGVRLRLRRTCSTRALRLAMFSTTISGSTLKWFMRWNSAAARMWILCSVLPVSPIRRLIFRELALMACTRNCRAMSLNNSQPSISRLTDTT